LQLNRFDWYRRLCIDHLNGNRLAFIATTERDPLKRQNAPANIYLADDSGQQVCPLTFEQLHIVTFAWSPDGKRLAFTVIRQIDLAPKNWTEGVVQ